MIKKLLALMIFVFAFTMNMGHAASNNSSSYLLYDVIYRSNSDRNVGTALWIPLPSQPTKSFRYIAIKDTSGQTMELGTGPYSNIVRQMIIPASTGASAQIVQYNMGLSYAGTSSSIYIRAVSGNATSGENMINFFY